MTRGYLKPLRREDIEVWRAAEVQVGELGERRKVHALANVYQALVTPLGADAALKLGLTTEVERWRTRLPADADVQLSDRVRVRGRDWQIVSLTRWHSYVLIVFEGV